MITDYPDKGGNVILRGSLVLVISASILLVLSGHSPLYAQIKPQHAETPTHQILMEYAAAKASELPTPLGFSVSQGNRMREGAYDEDMAGPTCFGQPARAIQHGWNVLTDEAFQNPCSSVVPTMTARNAAAARWAAMMSAFANGSLDGGDDVGAWHFLGRVSHLLQDMTSSLHVFAVDHAGIPLISRECQFERYWKNQASTLRTILDGAGGPLHSGTLDAKAMERLDSFTQQRLQDRFDNGTPNKNADDARGWMEVVAWITYFRATYWGEVRFGTSGSSGPATTSTTTGTTFTDGYVAGQVNALHTMFNGNVQWRVSWFDNFYEITDRQGYLFRWMSWSDIDDWASSGRFWANGQMDSSTRIGGSDDDDRGVRITGRFWFDARELGLDTSGSFNRFCYPHRYPNGDSMTQHLHEYYGAHLFPLTVRYNAGLLGLANRRVTVRTGNATPANDFMWGRMDNFGSPPSFNVGSGGKDFFFVAKSQITLTAPAVNQDGHPFVRWLRNGGAFSGNTDRTITINTAASPIPQGGVIYTAVFGPAAPSAPSGLTATAVSFSQVNLTWSDNSIDEDGFRIDRATSPTGPWTLLGSVGAGVNFYTDTTVNCDALYYYRVLAYNAGASSPYSNTAVGNTSLADQDADGLPDCWMIQHFGHPTGQANDLSRADDDRDGDGLSNRQEFIAGTDPLNAASAFRVNAVSTRANGRLAISFPSVAGKVYNVFVASDLVAGDWGAATYAVTPDGLMQTLPLVGTGSEMTIYVDSAQPARFFRLGVWQ